MMMVLDKLLSKPKRMITTQDQQLLQRIHASSQAHALLFIYFLIYSIQIELSNLVSWSEFVFYVSFITSLLGDHGHILYFYVMNERAQLALI